MEATRDEGKYLIIQDKTGNVATFFRYKGIELPFAKESLKVTLGQQKEADAVEMLRKRFVYCMGRGDRLLVDCDKLAIDFKAKFNDSTMFDTAKFFDFTEGRKSENYLKIVKEEENHGPGGLNPGHYMLDDNFNMSFSTQIQDPDELSKFVDSIPHSEKMRKIVIC